MDDQNLMQSFPEVDVILPTRNRSDLILPTLESLAANRYPNFRVWVVDQSEGSETAEIVQRFSQSDNRFNYLPIPSQGVDIARNHGARAGSAPIIAFIDDDCRAEPDWLENLVDEFQTDPQISSVFGMVIPGKNDPSHNQNSHATQHLAEVLPMAMKTSPQRKVFHKNRFDLGFGHGANMSFSRRALEEIGMFDELLGAGAPLRSYPERDVGYRILAQGGRIVYSPRVIVHHYHWRAFAVVKATYRNYAIGTGAAAGKYLRCGDLGGAYLLLEWVFDQGFRQVLSGVLKWRSWEKIQVGLLQLIYPWVGLVHGSRYKVDREKTLYIREG